VSETLGRLKPLLVDELDRVSKAREGALRKLEELRRRVAGGNNNGSPSSSSSPDPALVAAAGRCGRCRGSELGARDAVCDHCSLDELFLAWELSLFALTTRAVNAGGVGARARGAGGGGVSAEDAIRAAQAAALARVGRGGLGEEGERNDLDPATRRADGVSAAEVVRHPSEAERAMRVLRNEVARVRRPPAEAEEAEGEGQPKKKKKKSAAALAAEAEFEAATTLARVGGCALDALSALRDKLFLKARALALAQRGLLYAADELDMATTTLQLGGIGSGGGGQDVNFSAARGHAALYTLAPHELPHRAAELEAEAAAAKSDLRRALGTLRYLRGLAGEGGNGGGGEINANNNGGGGEPAPPSAPAAAPAAPASAPASQPRKSNNPSAAPRVGMCPVCHDDFAQQQGGGGGGGKGGAKAKAVNANVV